MPTPKQMKMAAQAEHRTQLPSELTSDAAPPEEYRQSRFSYLVASTALASVICACRKFGVTCCALHAEDASGERFRPQTQYGCTALMRHGRTWRSACSTTRAKSAPGGMK